MLDSDAMQQHQRCEGISQIVQRNHMEKKQFQYWRKELGGRMYIYFGPAQSLLLYEVVCWLCWDYKIYCTMCAAIVCLCIL